jgi:tetratricopeptide (TPR) repeat protein
MSLQLRRSRLLLPFLGLASFALVATVGCHRDPNVRKQKYLESGDRYEKTGKHKEATIQYANALKIDPNFADAHYSLSRTYLAMGNPLAAYGELLKAVDLKPGNVKARIELGLMQLQGNVPDKALEQAKAVIAIDPKNSDAYALMAGIARRKGDPVEALKDIQQALTLDPNRSEYHSQLAMLQAAESAAAPDKATEATAELRKAIELNPKNIVAHLVLSGMLEKSGDIAGAEQQNIAAIQAVPTDISARASLAGVYRRAGDQAKVQQTLREAAEANPDNEDAVGMLKDYLIQTKQLDLAETSYAELTSKFPKSTQVQVAYADVLATRGEFDKLRPVVANLIKADGNNPQVEVLNSAILLKDNKLNEAFDQLQKGAKNSPENVQIQIALAKVATLKGDSALSESSYQQAVRLQPRSIEAQTGMAMIASRKGDAAKLSQVADTTLEYHPDFLQAYLWRATAEANQKQFDKAIADLQFVIQKDPKNSGAMVELGQIYLHEGKGAEANTLLVKALDTNPESLSALNMLVSSDLAAKQPAKAIARVQEQIAKSPKNAALYDELALVQFATKDVKGARDSARTAMQLSPADGRAVQMFAQTSAQLGDVDGAIAAWQQWDTAHPNNPQAISMLAVLEDQKGDHAKAEAYYKKSLDLQPDQAMAQNNLAYTMVENGGNLDTALSLAQSARRTLPHSSATADTLAWVYFHKDRYTSARDLFEEAIKGDPENASIHYHLGLTYSKLSDKANATKELKKAISLDPDKPVGKLAAEALAKLG